MKTFSISAGRSRRPCVEWLRYQSAVVLCGAERRKDLLWQHAPTRRLRPAAPNYTGPFITVAILFGIFGFLTSLNNVLVAKLEAVFRLEHGPAMLATAAWFFAYLVFSVPAAKVIEMVGYKRTMVISLFVMVVRRAAVSFPRPTWSAFP